MHVLVTGASGFAGKYVVRELLAHGHRVSGLDAHVKLLVDSGVRPVAAYARSSSLAFAAGLVDGSTNFYVTGALSQPGQPLSGSIANFLSTCPACGPVTGWQGVTFAGLIPVDYQFTYIPIAFPTANWTPFNDSLNNTFSIT